MSACIRVTLYPDGRLADEISESAAPAPIRHGLTGSAEAMHGYVSIPLTDGLELHHLTHTPDAAPNAVADTLAAQYGIHDLSCRGPALLTGPSCESDTAPGMDLLVHDALLPVLTEAALAAGLPLWCRRHPEDIVTVYGSDYAPGDTFWFLGQPQRYRGHKDFPADCVTVRMFPGARIFSCENGWEMTDTGAPWPERADQAPPGYWQRTGDQLLPT